MCPRRIDALLAKRKKTKGKRGGNTTEEIWRISYFYPKVLTENPTIFTTMLLQHGEHDNASSNRHPHLDSSTAHDPWRWRLQSSEAVMHRMWSDHPGCIGCAGTALSKQGRT